jgi:hypothetical protein
MGNTLSGLTPSQTFQGLIKVGNNTNVTETAKVLSDGAGTDLPMEVSTAGVNLTGSPTVNSVAIANTNEVAAKQDTLVSGTNIKTINGATVLGSGNIAVVTAPSGVSGAIQFSDGSAFASDAANLFYDDANKRFGIGTNTPTATNHIKGSGTTTATTALLVQNSAGTTLMSVRDNAAINIGAGGLTTFTGSVQNATGPMQALQFFNASSPFNFGTSSIYSITGTTPLITSGQRDAFLGQFTFAPTSGTAVLNVLNASPTINQTGGANGITRGLYINPTLTAAADFRAIEVAAGNVLIGNAAANTAKLSIKGSGTTSATTSLLVQNSAGAQSLKVSDDNNVVLGDGVFTGFVAGSGQIGRYLISAGTVGNVFGDYTSFAASAIVQCDSTTRGFLPPRMTTTQKNAITSPAAGLVVYDTTLNKLCVYTTAWETITSL